MAIRPVDRMTPAEAARWYAERAERLRPKRRKCRFCHHWFVPKNPWERVCCDKHRTRENHPEPADGRGRSRLSGYLGPDEFESFA